jgi:hypothetical protein
VSTETYLIPSFCLITGNNTSVDNRGISKNISSLVKGTTQDADGNEVEVPNIQSCEPGSEEKISKMQQYDQHSALSLPAY